MKKWRLLWSQGFALLVLRTAASACGMIWEVPVTHFEGVDEKGYVCYAEQIDEIDCGQGLKIPLIITFRSDRETSSPYLGKGWILALLDSSFVQTAENSFQMTQPDGWVRPFYRAKSGGALLDGGSGWKAEIKDDSITAWASCGWKLTYYKGRLATIGTPNNRQLELVRSGLRVTELREAGSTKLGVEFKDGSGVAISFNGKRVQFSTAQRPRVESIAGQRVIGGVDQSLSSISGVAEGVAAHFEFSVTDKIQPSFKLSDPRLPDRLLVWDAATKLLLADGNWIYDIKAPGSPTENAAISRVDGRGHSEYWFEDNKKGQIVETQNGRRTVRSYFATGLLAGRVRKVSEGPEGKEIETYRASYDESGRLITEFRVIEGRPTTLRYENPVPTAPLGSAAYSLYRDGVLASKYLVDPKTGYLTIEDFSAPSNNKQ